MKVSDVSPTIPEDRPGIEETLVNTASISGIEETLVNNVYIVPSYPLWTSCARKDAKKLSAAQPSNLVISKPSNWIVSSGKKRRKIIDKRCAKTDVADPASILLVNNFVTMI